MVLARESESPPFQHLRPGIPEGQATGPKKNPKKSKAQQWGIPPAQMQSQTLVQRKETALGSSEATALARESESPPFQHLRPGIPEGQATGPKKNPKKSMAQKWGIPPAQMQSQALVQRKETALGSSEAMALARESESPLFQHRRVPRILKKSVRI
jgi:hypothetical protein